MSAQPRRSGIGVRRTTVVLAATAACLAAAVFAAAAVAKTLTLSVAKNAKVTDNSTTPHTTSMENLGVNSRGRAVYTLSGETPQHVKCTKASMCLNFWFPVTANSKKSLSKSKSIKGKLGLWHRGNTKQVTLNNHPLYTFALDTKKNEATGQNIKSFGGTWNVVKTSSSSSSSPPPPMQPSPPSPTPPTYPPY